MTSSGFMNHRVIATACGLAGGALAAFAVAGGSRDAGTPVRIDVAGGTWAANETSAAASDANPQEIVAAWNDWRESSGFSETIRMGVGLSLDGGATWSDFVVRPPAANQSNVEGDPMTVADPRTGALWVGAISFNFNGGIFVARKDPGEASFEPSVMAWASGSADKCWMAAGPRPAEPDSTRVYIAFNQGVIRSDDLGETWSAPVSLGGGIGYLPRIGTGGELYVTYWDFGTGMMLKRSLDGGATFTTHTVAVRMDVWGVQDGSRFPGTFRVPSMLSLAVDPNDGTLYAIYPDTSGNEPNGFNVDLYFTKSTDRGTSWSPPVVMNGDGTPPGDQFFPWIEVDGAGRLHTVYFDSRHTDQNDGTVNGMFDAYYAGSDDGGATWTEMRLTRPSWNSNDDGLDRPFQFMGDYLGLAVAGNSALPVYLDTAAGDPDVYTTVITTIDADGDVNGDGVVDVLDLLLVLAGWGICDAPPCPSDVNGDGVTDVEDLLIVLASWS